MIIHGLYADFCPAFCTINKSVTRPVSLTPHSTLGRVHFTSNENIHVAPGKLLFAWSSSEQPFDQQQPDSYVTSLIRPTTVCQIRHLTRPSNSSLFIKSIYPFTFRFLHIDSFRCFCASSVFFYPASFCLNEELCSSSCDVL